jgi:hypothetical protein
MKRMIAAMVAALLMVSLVASGAFAATSKMTNWKVSWGPNYARTGSATTTGGAGFAFSTDSASYVDLLTTTKDKSLLGDLTGKTITATFTVTASSDAAFVYGDASCGPSNTYVRPYFVAAGKFNTENYWWAVSGTNTSYTFLDGNASDTITLTVPLVPANWSGYNGASGTVDIAGFTAAVAKVGTIGLSFGGGCFFANGVGLSAGTASFLLTSYTITP